MGNEKGGVWINEREWTKQSSAQFSVLCYVQVPINFFNLELEFEFVFKLIFNI